MARNLRSSIVRGSEISDARGGTELLKRGSESIYKEVKETLSLAMTTGKRGPGRSW